MNYCDNNVLILVRVIQIIYIYIYILHLIQSFPFQIPVSFLTYLSPQRQGRVNKLIQSRTPQILPFHFTLYYSSYNIQRNVVSALVQEPHVSTLLLEESVIGNKSQHFIFLQYR